MIDANFRTYYAQERGNAKVFVEKYYVAKKDYISTKVPIGSKRGTDQYLIKEDQFTDIGGGYATFL